MVEPSTYTVYTLRDPRTEQVHYVGTTSIPLEYRYRGHLYDKKTNTEKATWIAELRQIGLKPIIEVVEDNLSSNDANTREKYWIQFYRAKGMPLTNMYPN
jgi:hypothetical protein